MFRACVCLMSFWSSFLLMASPKRHSLMISHPKIIKGAEAEGLGGFSFGSLSLELAKAHYQKPEITQDEYSQFIRSWLNQFISTRPGIEPWVTCAWAEAPRGDLRCKEALLLPEKAPFKLLAISYRPDLADKNCEGKEGEFRFTFGLTQEALLGRKAWDIPATEMTVIFEYALHKAHPLERTSQEWAQEFLDLDRPELCKDFCPAYQSELLSLAQDISSYHPELPGGSALGQIRSNEVVGDPAFNPDLTRVLRQFGEELSQCYRVMKASPENFAGGVQECRQLIRNANLPAGPIQLAAFALDKALGALVLGSAKLPCRWLSLEHW